MKNTIILLLLSAVCAFAVEFDFTDSGKRLDPAFKFTIRGTKTTFLPEGLKVDLPEKDNPSGIISSRKYPEFTPDGAFIFEAEFCLLPIEKNSKTNRFFLWDNKYLFNGKTHSGFMVYLVRQGYFYQANISLGLEGNRQVGIMAEKLTLGDGKYHTLKFKFDPSGRQEIYCDGILKKSVVVSAGKIAAAKYPTAIGARFASLYFPLRGIIRKIRITPVESLKVNAVDFIARKYGSRRVFVRREKNSSSAVKFRNTTNRKISGEVRYSVKEVKFVRKTVFSVNAGESGSVSFPVETNLLPGKYTVELTFADHAGNILGKGSMQYSIVPEFTDILDLKADDFLDRKNRAAAHRLGITSSNWIISPRRGKMTKALAGKLTEDLDNYLEDGFRCNDKVVINERFFPTGKFLRVDRNGKAYPRKSLDVAEDNVYREALKASRDAAAAVGNHPAWDEIYPNNELRDGSRISFSENTRNRLKKATGLDIPADAGGNMPVSYDVNYRMPWNRIVPVSDPELRFWTWFWKEGDGWDRLNGDTAEVAEKIINRKDFTSRLDPATRALPYLGIGGKISTVGTWTYNNPDPIRLGQTIDELLTLADNRKKVAIGNQGIWYRDQVAPKEIKVKNPPAWLAKEPDARYISPAPDMMLEAFWIAITRKIDRMNTHGQGSWLGPIKHTYRYTNPGVTKVFPVFANEVVKPLGSALKHVDEVTPEVVILESFTNALYGGGHTWGWGRGWIADLHMALQWAHIQPGICYEEQLLRGDYDDGKVKVLILPSLRVLSDKLLNKIRELQGKGIYIMGDENLNISLLPDFRINSFSNTRLTADQRKKALQAIGIEIRNMLAPVLTPCMASDCQDLILRRRMSGEAHYLFAVNDKREYGNYVGQWKKVMEKGLPLSADFTVGIPAAAAYDIVRHQLKSFSSEKGISKFSVDLKPGSGSIIVLLPRPVAGVSLNAPKAVKRGEDFCIEAFPSDKNGKSFKAVLPMAIQFISNGKTLPGTGFYATDSSGKLVFRDTAALNMPRGKAIFRVKCLTSGLSTSKEIIID